MIRKFCIFKPHKSIIVSIDDGCSVLELIIKARAECGIFELKGLDYITVYDVDNRHVICDNHNTIASENLSQSLCFAYYVPDKFLHVEGGWASHMIEMDAVQYIDEPFDFGLVFSHMLEDTICVASKKLTFRELYYALRRGKYICDKGKVNIYKTDRYDFNHKLLKTIPVEDIVNNEQTVWSILGDDWNCNMVISFM